MLRLAPGRRRAVGAAARRRRRGGGWEELVAGASEVATAAGTTPEAARIWREIARALREELGQPEDALAAYREALIGDPGDRITRDAEADLLRELGRWQDLVAALRATSGEADDPDRAAALMLEAAEVHETQMGDAAGAITAYETVLAIAPALDDRGAGARTPVREREALGRSGLAAGAARGVRDAARTRPRCAAGAPASSPTIWIRWIARRRSWSRWPPKRPTSPIASCCAARADLQARRAPRRLPDDAAAAGRRQRKPRRAARDPAPAGRGGRDPPRRAGSRVGGAGADPAPRAARRRRLRGPRAHLPRRRPAGGAGCRAAAPPGGHGDHRGAARDACPRSPRPTNASWTSGRRRWTRTRRRRRSAIARQEIYAAICRLGERLGRWDVATEAAAQVGGDGAAERGRAGGAGAHQPAHGELRSGAGDVPRRRRPRARAGGAGGAADRGGTIIVDTALGKEDQAVELYVRALAAIPTTRRRPSAWPQIYATRGRWSDVEELLDVVIDGLESGRDTDRLVALQLRLAEACVQLARPSRTRWTRRSTPGARARGTRRVAAGAAQVRRPAHAAPRVEGRARALRIDPARRSGRRCRRPTPPRWRCRSAPATPSWATRTPRSPRTRTPSRSSPIPPGAGGAGGGVRGQGGLGRVGGGAPRARRRSPSPRSAPESRRIWATRTPTSCPIRRRAEACYRKALELEPAGAADAAQAAGDLHEGQALAARDRSAEPAGQDRGRSGAAGAHAVHGGADPARRAGPARRGGGAAGALPGRGARHDRRLRGPRGAAQGGGDWKALAPSYRRMVKRLPRVARPRCASACGRGWASSRSRQLHDRKLALQAFEAAAALDPADVAAPGDAGPPLRAGRRPTRASRRSPSHQKLLARDPHRTDSYRALAKLYGDVGELDKQWCVASALYYLKKADPGMEAVFRRHRPPQVRLPQRAFTEETWQRIVHPDEDRLLDGLFAIVGALPGGAGREAARRPWGWDGGTASTCRPTAARPCWR